MNNYRKIFEGEYDLDEILSRMAFNQDYLNKEINKIKLRRKLNLYFGLGLVFYAYAHYKKNKKENDNLDEE